LDFFTYQPEFIVEPVFRIVKGTIEDYREFFDEYGKSYEFYKKIGFIKEVQEGGV
jgi:hypothetical protein